MEQQSLAAPVEYGDAYLAPTVELAALTELGSLRLHEDRLAAIVRIAASVAEEERLRADVRSRRALVARGLVDLPRRR
jgi:hypothetical protein